MSIHYTLGGRSAISTLGLLKTGSKLHAAQEAARAAAKGSKAGPNMWERIPAHYRAGGIVGLGVGGGMLGVGHAVNGHNDAGDIAGAGITGGYLGYGAGKIRKGLGDQVTSIVENMENNVRGGATPEAGTPYQDIAKQWDTVEEAAGNPPRQKARGYRKADMDHAFQQELKRGGGGAVAASEGDHLLDALRKQNPGLSDRQLKGMLHPDRLAHEPASVNRDMARSAWDSLHAKGRQSAKPVDAMGQAARDVAGTFNENRKAVLQDATKASRKTFLGPGGFNKILKRFK